MRSQVLLLLLLSTLCLSASAQSLRLYGMVSRAEGGNNLAGATLFIEPSNTQLTADARGKFEVNLPPASYTVKVFAEGYTAITEEIKLVKDTEANFRMEELSQELEGVEISDQRNTIGISRLRAVDGFAIYEAKKNELIVLDDFASNKVATNARQVFAKVPGLNIWESDFAGLQLDIAARGLGPSRTANFNTRQNGYDMSADALGYPESYYLPAIQAVERVEVVRGAASLQYGTQFGGMLNFKIRDAPEKPIEVNLEQGVGSFGLLNSFVSAGGQNEKL